MNKISALVSSKDIRAYFKGEGWRVFGHQDEIEISGDFVEISLSPEKTIFLVNIENLEDPDDSEKGETENPIQFIIKFLQTGTEADEILRKMSSYPSNVSFMLTLLASAYDNKIISTKLLASNLSRVAALISETILSADISVNPPIELKKLLEDMKQKGWKARIPEFDKTPQIEVDIASIFKVIISVEKIIWNYEFRIREYDNSRRKGQTEDPIAEFRNYYMDSDIQDMYEAAKWDKSQMKKIKELDVTNKPGRIKNKSKNKADPFSETEFAESPNL